MNLEIFRHIDDVIELYESKRDIYKLIAEEIQEFFEKNVFSNSKYTLNMIYRLKSIESIREKLVRNNYLSQADSVEDVMSIFQDLIGFRIECKFIDDEKYVYNLLVEMFSETDDGVYFYEPTMPKIRLKMSDEQPQKQKNGFDIYKMDGIFMLGKEPVRFELQIKALVNSFWGEIEHRIIYKNNSYLIEDGFVEDLMMSIKKSLNMIDSQLYVLYKRFKRAEGVDFERNNAKTVEKFIAKMVYDTFSSMMREQVGFSIDFKKCCDAVVRYIMVKNHADDMEAQGKVMIDLFNSVNEIANRDVRVDGQIEFDRKIEFSDVFCDNIAKTVVRLVNLNFRWHLFCLVLFSLHPEQSKEEVLESSITYYKAELYSNRSFALLEGYEDAEAVKKDLLDAFSEVFRERKRIEYICEKGMATAHRALNSMVPKIVDELEYGTRWSDICDDCIAEFMVSSAI